MVQAAWSKTTSRPLNGANSPPTKAYPRALGLPVAKGVLQNYILAHMWLNLAGFQEAMDARDRLASSRKGTNAVRSGWPLWCAQFLTPKRETRHFLFRERPRIRSP